MDKYICRHDMYDLNLCSDCHEPSVGMGPTNRANIIWVNKVFTRHHALQNELSSEVTHYLMRSFHLNLKENRLEDLSTWPGCSNPLDHDGRGWVLNHSSLQIQSIVKQLSKEIITPFKQRGEARQAGKHHKARVHI